MDYIKIFYEFYFALLKIFTIDASDVLALESRISWIKMDLKIKLLRIAKN